MQLRKALAQSFGGLLIVLFCQQASAVVLEDGEDRSTGRWYLIDKKPKGAAIRNVQDKQTASRVIFLKGKGTKNRFRLRAANGEPWNNREEFVFKWQHKYKGYFALYVRVSTRDGEREIKYTPDDTPASIVGNQVRHGLGKAARNGQWQSFERNLQRDIQAVEPNNTLLSVNDLVVRGSGFFDNISLTAAEPATPPEVTDFAVQPAIFTPTGAEQTAKVAFHLDKPSHVTITIRQTVSGHVVKEHTIPSLDAGAHIWQWEGKNKQGDFIAPGSYRISIQAEDQGQVSETYSMVQRLYY